MCDLLHFIIIFIKLHFMTAALRVTKKKKGFQNVLLRTHQENEIQWSIVRLSSPSP